MIAVPAMLGTIAVVHLSFVGRIVQVVEQLLGEVDGVIEVIAVGAADVEVNLAAQFGAEFTPVAAQDLDQVIVLLPVIRNSAINPAGSLVEDRRRVAVGSLRAIDGLPDVVLLA